MWMLCNFSLRMIFWSDGKCWKSSKFSKVKPFLPISLGLWIKLNSLYANRIKETSEISFSSNGACKKVRICDITNAENSYISNVIISRYTWATIKIFYRNVIDDHSYRITREQETLNFGLNSPLKLETIVKYNPHIVSFFLPPNPD